MRIVRRIPGGRHVDGDDVPVSVELHVEGRIPGAGLVLAERIARLGERETPLRRREGRLRGRYVLQGVPRGRYPIEEARILIEDPFALASSEQPLAGGDAVLVYPKLVPLDTLFSETGSRTMEGRRLLLRRPSGFDLHSVREYEQGESLRRVHWPSTAKRGQLMVKELEDAPRDEIVVLLDADAAGLVGTPPDSTFEVAVRAAGSMLRLHVDRARRVALVVNSASRMTQRVQAAESDWHRALELLAGVEPDGHTPLGSVLADEVGPAARAIELAVVTSRLSGGLVDRMLQRSLSRHGTSVVYVDPRSFAAGAQPEAPLDAEAAAHVHRLDRGGVPVAVVRRGDDLQVRLTGRRIAVPEGEAAVV
jgi:uncharacterized protein (DUF58 family)